MCWNKEVSFLSLTIGTIFNILLMLKFNQKSVRAIALIFQFVLFMQLFEGLSWISKETNNIQLSRFSTIMAFVFNVLQPIVAGLLCILVNKKVKYIIQNIRIYY